jgi:hypothetical protein
MKCVNLGTKYRGEYFDFREGKANYMMRSFIICTVHQILLGSWNQKRRRGKSKMHRKYERSMQHFGLKI